MKKIGILALLLLFLTFGCGKVDVEKVKSDFEDSVTKSKSYVLNGTMEIMNNEDTFVYTVEASFLKDDYYKVRLVNQTNNHEQIILKNTDGVYVVTPSLNKSFKFQSEWPSNSSQSYLLAPLVNDVKSDSETTLEEQDNHYVLKAKVNYPNNTELVYERIYFDKSMNLEKIEVCNSDDVVKIKVDVQSLDLKAGLDKDDFVLDDLMSKDCCSTDSCEEGTTCENNTTTNSESKTNNSGKYETNSEGETTNKDKKTSALEDAIYPLYIPSETYLTSKEVVDTDTGDRVILTYSGSKNFVLVEEVASVSDEFEVIPVYGDPLLLNDSVAALQANSVHWTSNNMEYYLTGNDLSNEEMLSIATSLTNVDLVTSSQVEK